MQQRLSSWATYIGALGIAVIAAAFLLGIVTNLRRDVLLLFAGVGIVLIAFYIFTRPREETDQINVRRTALFGSNALIVALAVIGIIAALNFIVDKQFSQRIDLTSNKEHTLSDQTVKVLQSLKDPVRVTGFFTPQTQAQRDDAESLLKDYSLKTDKLQLNWIDPDANPAAARAYDNVLPGTLVFEQTTNVSGGKPRTEKVYDFSENAITNAILKVTQTVQPAVYFTTGHGELSPTSFEQTGLSSITDLLKQINYKVETLNTTAISDTLPADTRAIVIAAPTKPFAAEDEKIVKDYLDKGGRVLLLLEPNADPGLKDTLTAWGITLPNDLVLDPALNYRGNAPIPVFLEFPSSPITENLAQFGVYFPGARSIKNEQKGENVVAALFNTSADACAKTDFEALKSQQQIACTDQDQKGPFVLGYSIEGGSAAAGANPDQRARLIVLGNAAFATNQWINNQDALGNQQLFVNMINWLAGQEELISIPARESNVRTLNALTGGELNLVFWTTVGLVPLAALVLGGILWWKRR